MPSCSAPEERTCVPLSYGRVLRRTRATTPSSEWRRRLRGIHLHPTLCDCQHQAAPPSPHEGQCYLASLKHLGQHRDHAVGRLHPICVIVSLQSFLSFHSSRSHERLHAAISNRSGVNVHSLPIPDYFLSTHGTLQRTLQSQSEHKGNTG